MSLTKRERRELALLEEQFDNVNSGGEATHILSDLRQWSRVSRRLIMVLTIIASVLLVVGVMVASAALSVLALGLSAAVILYAGIRFLRWIDS